MARSKIQRGQFIRFRGGPLDGQERFMALDGPTIVLPGCCPYTEWDNVSGHLPDCDCPNDWKGPQEYQCEGNEYGEIATYIGRRPWPTEEESDS
jgi:hypothetical protein